MLYISWNQFKRQKSVCVFSILICMRDCYTWYLKEAIRYLYKKLYVSQSIFFFHFISQMNVNLRIWEMGVRSLTVNYSRNLHSIKTNMNLLVKVSLSASVATNYLTWNCTFFAVAFFNNHFRFVSLLLNVTSLART